MRYLFGLLCVCALGVMPLVGGSEAKAQGGSGGSAGSGGVGGDIPCEADFECEDNDTCTEDYCENNGFCVFEPIVCDDSNPCTVGTCTDGLCEFAASQDGSYCVFGDFAVGLCIAGDCRFYCETADECDDRNDCTADACTPFGDVNVCDNSTVANGTTCAGGMCQAGVCELTSLALPCSEQGILNAIVEGGGPYTFDCNGPTRVVTEKGIVINNDVVLDGEGNLTVDGNETADEVIGVEEGVTAELYGITVTRGREKGILNRGTLTLASSIVSGNKRGGIGNAGNLTMTGVTVSDNTCSTGCDGGGIANGGTLSIVNSTVSGNLSRGGGGGIINGGTSTIVNSTVSGNRATAEGGGISNESTLTITNCTVSGNISDEQQGSAVATVAGRTTILSSTLIDGDCQGPLTSNGYNIESPGETCGFDQTGDQGSVSADDLNLAPLQNNGGLTETHAITTDSAAFNSGTCEVATDQRGVDRPQGDACDVGAFELEGGSGGGGGGCSAIARGPSAPWGAAMLLLVLLLALRRREGWAS